MGDKMNSNEILIENQRESQVLATRKFTDENIMKINNSSNCHESHLEHDISIDQPNYEGSLENRVGKRDIF